MTDYTKGTLRPPTDLGQFYPPRPCKPWVRYSDSLIKWLIIGAVTAWTVFVAFGTYHWIRSSI